MPRGKRSFGDTLTGGSRDVNPQTMTIAGTMSAANTTTVVTQALPIPRLPTSVGKNLVIELLGVDWYSTNDQYGLAINQALAMLTTTSGIAPNMNLALQDPRSLSRWFREIQVFTAAGVLENNGTFQDDLTDEAGHGVLIATDQIFLQMYSAAKVNPDSYVAKLFYRWKEVSLEEYIGIVQSQQ